MAGLRRVEIISHVKQSRNKYEFHVVCYFQRRGKDKRVMHRFRAHTRHEFDVWIEKLEDIVYTSPRQEDKDDMSPIRFSS